MSAIRATLRTTSRCSTRSLLVAPVRTMTNIRDAGGAFAKREATEEERYAWEHEKEVIKKLRAQLKAKEVSAKEKLDKEPHLDPHFHEELKQVHVQPRAGGDAFSKREAAAEDRYIREHEREAQQLKKKGQ
ncbi:hypothetical protein DFS34DRAFT_649152 [Phlyctochytrium arcticum]|nr:hypothetical protein DFS34DRAFT_649152 [Phlyctochytrium arcticum]